MIICPAAGVGRPGGELLWTHAINSHRRSRLCALTTAEASRAPVEKKQSARSSLYYRFAVNNGKIARIVQILVVHGIGGGKSDCHTPVSRRIGGLL